MKIIIIMLVLLSSTITGYTQVSGKDYSESALLKKWKVVNSPFSSEPVYLNTKDTSTSYLKFNANHTYEALFKNDIQLGIWRLGKLNKTKLYLSENGSEIELPLSILSLSNDSCSLSIKTPTGAQTIKLAAQ
jgi:ABC-type oligopeptide transport system substrate-binding subunit